MAPMLVSDLHMPKHNHAHITPSTYICTYNIHNSTYTQKKGKSNVNNLVSAWDMGGNCALGGLSDLSLFLLQQYEVR